MTLNSMIAATNDVFPALIAGLEREFGGTGYDAMARDWIEAEAADFHWESRSGERLLGRYDAFESGDDELDRVAIIGCLDGHWFVAVMVVDGDGRVDRMLHQARFESAWHAHGAYLEAQ